MSAGNRSPIAGILNMPIGSIVREVAFPSPGKTSRRSRIFKLAGVAASLLILGVWGTSLRWSIAYRGLYHDLRLNEGCLSYSSWRGTPEDVEGQPVGMESTTGWGVEGQSWGCGSGWPCLAGRISRGFRPPFFYKGVSHVVTNAVTGEVTLVTHREIRLPFGFPFLVIAVPTAIVFWRDHRRRPPGHCRICGYNLTGNVSGVCPECGTSIST